MTQFLAALAVFILLHSVPAVPALRSPLIGRLGRPTYLIAYSLVSLMALAWVFHAALRLDYVPLWDAQPWQAWVPLVLSPIAVFLLIAGLASPNPASISLRRADRRPGAVTTITRHPVLWGFLLWAGSHLVPNGDLRSVILFGALAAFSAFGMVMAERRARRRLGAEWHVISSTTSVMPFAAATFGRTRLRIDRTTLASLAAAAALTAWLLTGGHAALFGADPLALATS
ncbi:NnrU family protein [Devosia nitrariae]|uniref:NnrU protein n=1 Tax=Devosia nitrariae TaxID=2071872 RepID=A0ABQ5W9S9_9HYPH|nr:NnrU family protein [Devosia nitrariae]GLQ56602.1 NnrU protein [Devosia nitrariae]